MRQERSLLGGWRRSLYDTFGFSVPQTKPIGSADEIRPHRLAGANCSDMLRNATHLKSDGMIQEGLHRYRWPPTPVRDRLAPVFPRPTTGTEPWNQRPLSSRTTGQSLRVLSGPPRQHCTLQTHGNLRFVEIPAHLSRGRDAHYCAPPAQNRTCGIPAYGSHLGCLTRKRWSGQGWDMRGRGSQRSASLSMSGHVVRSRWLRRRKARRQRFTT